MKSTSPFSRLVSSPASSPAFSITGPLVFFTFTPIALRDDVGERRFAETRADR